VTPLGSGRAQAVDFQLICATHRDLATMAAEGSFRSDLMYRLNGYEVRLPPLRLRPDRDALMQRLFLDLGGAGKHLRLGADAFDRLCRHAWPGNVRELVGVLRTTIALAEPGSVVDLAALPLGPAMADEAAVEPEQTEAAAPSALAALTQQAIEDALAAAGGQVALAARRLGVHRSTVYRHVRRRAG
jgi:transcriptional regulator of acetoin/glycerol metabolism